MASECAKSTAEHGFADVLITAMTFSIITALSIESLLATVVNAWNAKRTEIESKCRKHHLLAWTFATEPPLVVATPYLIVVIYHGDNFVSKPAVASFSKIFGIAE